MDGKDWERKAKETKRCWKPVDGGKEDERLVEDRDKGSGVGSRDKS